jgi:hypothetical protein
MLKLDPGKITTPFHELLGFKRLCIDFILFQKWMSHTTLTANIKLLFKKHIYRRVYRIRRESRALDSLIYFQPETPGALQK